MADIDKRMAARRARVEAANLASADATVAQTGSPADRETLTDYWTLPKTGPKTGRRTTLLNSAWTWTLIVYAIILAIAALSIAQNGASFLTNQGNAARMAIGAGLIYPAWRIGALISGFLKRHRAGDIMPAEQVARTGKPAKTARPGSVEARMEQRRARLEKARREGKL